MSTNILPRVVKTRDAATSIMRKLGIKAPAYGIFSRKLDDGRYEVDLPKAQAQGFVVNAAVKPTKPVKAKTKKAPAVQAPDKTESTEKPMKAKKEAAPRRESISSVAEDLILSGKTNNEVWLELKERFKLDDSKKSYPSWYRCRLKRQGKLEKTS